MSPVVAAFDVDGTLTVRDCVRPFLERVGGRRSLVAAVARRPVETVRGALRRDRDALKDVVVGGVYRGRSVAAVAAAGREFALGVADRMLRDDTLGRLRWHQRMGHRTVFVSASLASYLVPLAESLGVEEALCTDVETDHRRDHAVYADRLAGPNCRAAEKIVRLRRWMDDEGIGDAEIWAYGDSRGDREMLAGAHHPIWVRGVIVTAVPAGHSS
jgi:phosphatidylglycerophosphatase C